MALTDGGQTSGPMDASKYISTVTDRAYQGWGRGDERYQQAKDAYTGNKALADKITGKAFETGDLANRYSQEDRDFWTGTYKPAMQEQMDFARQYTTPQRAASNRQAAIGQAALAMQKEREGLEQGLMSHNIDPSSGRYAGLEAGLAAKEAMIQASAGTGADRYTEETGQKYLDNAIRQGAGLNAQAQGWTKTGQESLNQALNAPLAVEASGAQTMGTGLQWTAQGNDMIKEWLRADTAQTDAGLKGQEIALKRDEAKSKESSGAGAAIGAGMGILGGVAGAYFGGPMGMSLGSSLGSSLGGAMAGGGGGGGGVGGGTGGAFASAFAAGGGSIPRYARGGPVFDSENDGSRITEDDAWGNPSYLPGPETTAEIGFAEREVPDQMREQHEFVPFNTEPMRERLPMPQRGYAEGGDVTPEVEEPMDEQIGGQQGNMVPGEASPSNGAATDDVHAMVSVDEFVVPKDVAKWVGEKFLQNLIDKSRNEIAGATAKPEMAEIPQAIALSPPSFKSEGASV